jgi:nucleoside-diphosphate-sugar epimerase
MALPTKFLNDLNTKKNIYIWGDGKERKHFLYVKDLLFNLNNLLHRNKVGTYNLCPTESHSFVFIAKLVLKSFRSNLKIISSKRNGIKSNHIIDNSKILKIKGIKFTNMKSALKEYYLIFKQIYE